MVALGGQCATKTRMCSQVDRYLSSPLLRCWPLGNAREPRRNQGHRSRGSSRSFLEPDWAGGSRLGVSIISQGGPRHSGKHGKEQNEEKYLFVAGHGCAVLLACLCAKRRNQAH